MLDFKSFILENYQSYKVGDTVMIRYWLSGDVTPVRIVENPTNNYFIVSHKVEDSHFRNAPDQGIKVSEIMGYYNRPESIENSKSLTENPKIRPNTDFPNIITF